MNSMGLKVHRLNYRIRSLICQKHIAQLIYKITFIQTLRVIIMDSPYLLNSSHYLPNSNHSIKINRLHSTTHNISCSSNSNKSFIYSNSKRYRFNNSNSSKQQQQRRQRHWWCNNNSISVIWIWMVHSLLLHLNSIIFLTTQHSRNSNSSSILDRKFSYSQSQRVWLVLHRRSHRMPMREQLAHLQENSNNPIHNNSCSKCSDRHLRIRIFRTPRQA